jgi:hypothetical protein
MTMGDETPVTSLVLPVLIRPILSQVKMKKSISARVSLISIAYLFYTFQAYIREKYPKLIIVVTNVG